LGSLGGLGIGKEREGSKDFQGIKVEGVYHPKIVSLFVFAALQAPLKGDFVGLKKGLPVCLLASVGRSCDYLNGLKANSETRVYRTA